MRLFFILLFCISVIATAFSTAHLVTARFLSQQPFLHFSSLVCCIVGLIQCRGDHLQTTACTSCTVKRLRQATLCASIGITLSTLASLPTPSSRDFSKSNTDFAHSDLWLLLALSLSVQVCLPQGRTRHFVCGVIALAHAVMVIVTRYTANPKLIGLGGCDDVEECFLCWNSCDVRFWRKVASNMVAFLLTNLIGWHLACQNHHERRRCLCVALHSTARQSALQTNQKKLSRISRSIVPPALAADLERDFYSAPCIWSSPLVIYLRNVSFLSAELIGFYTSTINASFQDVERYPQPAPQHVVTFTNHLVGQIKLLCENHSCYAVHIRPSEILCVAGYPEVRVDHANSCVHLALGMNRLLRSLSNSAHVHLEAQIAIHTGEAYAAVLGRTMLTFDLLGADVLHLRRQLRAVAKPGRILVSRATFDQLPEGYEGELGPVVVDSSTNHHPVHLETLYVQPRKSADTSVSSTDGADTRWPTLDETISMGGLAQAFTRLAHQKIVESVETSINSTKTSTSVSILREMKKATAEEESSTASCLKGLCQHRFLPLRSIPTTWVSACALERHFLSPSSSTFDFLTRLCHSLPSSSSPPIHLSPQPTTSASSKGKDESAEASPLTSIKCDSCSVPVLDADLNAMCPLAEIVLWNRLFLRGDQLRVLRNALAWMLLLLVFLGVAVGLLVTRISFVLVVYICGAVWCLLLLIVFSIRRLDNAACLPVTLRQASVVFTIFLFLASMLLILMFVFFEVRQRVNEFASTTVLACLSLLSLFTLTPSVPPTPLNGAIVATIFSGLHVVFAVTRFIHLPDSASNSSSFLFWTTTLPDSLAAHIVFVLLVCLLPWQTVKLRHWTEQWIKRLVEDKLELTQQRFALEHLLNNQIPRIYAPAETSPDTDLGNDLSNCTELYPPHSHPDTAVLAITVHGIGNGDEMLQYHRSPIRSAALSQSMTAAVTASLHSTASHRSREATVIADAVRRLNRRICLIDQVACGDLNGDTGPLEDAVERVIQSISRPSLSFTKVHSVGNCVAYALLETDVDSQVGSFAVFLIRLFKELELQGCQQNDEESGSTENAFACRLQIGLHVGPTVSGVVNGPQFLLLHETLDFALRLANIAPPPHTSIDQSFVIASTDFFARHGAECLVGAQAAGDVLLWTPETHHLPRLIAIMKPLLSTALKPLVARHTSKKPISTAPDSASSTSPPPLPPHKRNYAVGEARYQNHHSPLLPRLDRKLSSPLPPPRHSSPRSKWAQKSTSLDVSASGGGVVDRASFSINEIEIVNGYAQPTTRLLGNRIRASPYCITKDTEACASHQSHKINQPVLKPSKVLEDGSRVSNTSSDNVFLAVEGACESMKASHSKDVTSLSSLSHVTTTNTQHRHHSNPLYTDNEYYDDDVDVNIIDDVNEVFDHHLDTGLEWIQSAPMFEGFSVSVSSPNFPNYRRPSTPPSNPRRYPPIAVGDGRKLTYVKPTNERISTPIDLLSTCAVSSIACDYEFEAGPTDRGCVDDEAEMETGTDDFACPESGDVPLLMDTSWMTSTDGGGGNDDKLPLKTQKMSDSLLVETGGPLEDDFSDFSSSAPVAVVDEDISSARILSAYTSGAEADASSNRSSNADEGPVILPLSYFPLTDHDAELVNQRRLPNVAPVRLPNFAAPHPPSSPKANHPTAQVPSSPPKTVPRMVDLTCPSSFPLNAPTVALELDIAEYDNLRHTPPHSAWRPRDAQGYRRGGLHPRKIANSHQHFHLNEHIVGEARRICRRLHAMGWQSSVSLQTQLSTSGSGLEGPSHCNGAATRKAIPSPPLIHPVAPVARRGDYVNSRSLLRQLHGFGSGTFTTVTSQIDDDDDDDQMTDDGTFDNEFPDDQQNKSLLVSENLWRNVGRARSLSNDDLSIRHASDVNANTVDALQRPHSRCSAAVLARDLLLRRAANVRQLLPLELQPFVLPGCFSNVSANTTYARSNGVDAISPHYRPGDGRCRQRDRLVIAVRGGGGGVKRSFSDPLLLNGAAANLNISLVG